MSDMNNEIAILEQEEKIANAEAAKKQIALRIAKRKRDNRNDEEHLSLQDETIEKAQAEIKRLQAL